MNRVDFCCLPHYRPNLWNGAACKPSLLRVGEGRIQVFHHSGRLLFDEPLQQTSVRVTFLGTMKIRTPRKSWAFYGRGSAISAGAGEEQTTYVHQFWDRRPPYPQFERGLPLLRGGGPAMGEGVSLKPLARLLVAGGARPG